MKRQEEEEVSRKRRKEEETFLARAIEEDAVEAFRIAGERFWREILRKEALLGSIREFIKRNKTIRVSKPHMLLPLAFLLPNEEEIKEWSIRAASDLPKDFLPLPNEEDFFYDLQKSIEEGSSEVKETSFFKSLLLYICLGGRVKEEQILLLKKRFLKEPEISVKYFLFKVLLGRFFSLSGDLRKNAYSSEKAIQDILIDARDLLNSLLIKGISGHLMRTRNNTESSSIYPLLTPWEILKKTFLLPLASHEKLEVIKAGIKSKSQVIIRDAVKEIFNMYRRREIDISVITSSSLLDPTIWYADKEFLREAIKETEKLLLEQTEDLSSFSLLCSSWRSRISSLGEEEALLFLFLLFFLPAQREEEENKGGAALSLLLSEIRRRIERIPSSKIPEEHYAVYCAISWFQGKKENKKDFLFSSLLSLCKSVNELFKKTKRIPNNLEGLCAVVEISIKKEEKKERILLLREIVKLPFLDPVLSQVNFLLLSLTELTEEEALKIDLSWIYSMDLRPSSKLSLKSTLLINITEKYLEILSIARKPEINIVDALERAAQESRIEKAPSLVRAIERVKKAHKRSRGSTREVEVQRVKAIHIEPGERPLNRLQKKKEREFLVSSFYDAILSGKYPDSSVSNIFSSYEEYYDVFSPLIIQEALCSLEEEEKEEILGVVTGIQRGSLFSELKVEVKNRSTFSNNDFILIISEEDKSFCGRGIVSIDGSLRKNEISIKTKENDLFKHILRINIRISTCLVTHAREYHSLISLQRSPFFLKHLLLPSSPRSISSEEEEIEALRDVRNREMNQLNDSQKKAINSSLKRTISLIQGPPGTGKTKTLSVLVVEALLRKKKVLVTAPSNAAVSWAMESILSLLENIKEIKWIRIGDSLSSSSLSSYNLFFSTLSTSGSKLLKEVTVDIVVVDEACQATEPSTLIPLCLKPTQLILVGDDMQLPPTVVSNNEFLRISLFERIRKKNPPLLLNIQYRMHKDIAFFPNKRFYGDRIINGIPSTHRLPLAFIEAKGREASEALHGKVNHQEAEDILLLIKRIHSKYKRIGVISPYKAQCSLISKKLNKLNITNIEVSTVDGFQGQEKECIILSTVRTNRIGFLNDYRRVNVAVTRAKESLIIFGSPLLLKKDSTWRELLSYFQEKEAIYSLKEVIKILS